MTPQDFTKEYYQAALDSEKVTSVPALFTLAQAALESGWGEHAPGNNFFGIKAGANWTGKTTSKLTKEFDRHTNSFITVNALFRAYDNPVDSFKDHGMFLRQRFSKSIQLTDAKDFVKSIQNDYPYKYATDPDYVEKISELIDKIKSLESNEPIEEVPQSDNEV